MAKRLRSWRLAIAATIFLLSGAVAQAQRHGPGPPLPAGEILVTMTLPGPTAAPPALESMRPDGSHLRLVAKRAANAAVTRDTSTIAFERGGEIWTMRRDGSAQRRVTTPPHGWVDVDPAWSADGATLYFSRRSVPRSTEETASLFSVRRDGTALRRLTHASPNSGIHNEPACHEHPSTSPDGRLIVYTSIVSCFHGVGAGLAAVTADGRRARLPFRIANVEAVEPEYVDAAWSPAGEAVVYGVYDDASRFDAIYTATSRSALLVAKWQGVHVFGDALPPAWSPDGKWIAFVRGAYPTGDVWVVRRDGTGVRRVTRSSIFSEPVWLPPR